MADAPRRPLSTDEWPDRIWGRPVARLLVKGLLRTPITANQATALAGACGVAAGVALGLGSGVVAAAALALYLALDCADGQLARLGRGGGVLGRLADGIGDYVTAVSVHLGWIAWMSRSHDLVESVLWGVGAGASMAWSSFLLDRYKRRYRGDCDDMDEVRRAVEASRGLLRPMYRMFLPYAERIGGGCEIADLLAYQGRVRVPMALWLLVGPSSHFVAMIVCALLREPRLYAMIAVVPFNALTVVALLLQTSLERRVVQRRA